MKKFLPSFLLLILLASCTSQKNTDEFIAKTQGRYLFNANEVLEIYFKEKILHAKWRGNDAIELLKVNDSSFYMKALNEKIIFTSTPEMHIELAEKKEHKGVLYYFKKMHVDEKTPNEYFEAQQFDKALQAYKLIQKQDSLSPIIRQHALNSLGYKLIKKNDFDAALEIFKINTILYPENSNVFDSLGEAYFLKKDTVNAIINFKKALSINPENRNSKRFLKKITKNK
ncbi:tetratricopeptide repeat protein [Polaribacter sp.]|uniref:tetratricopeptide repeat protein n=1 Tax=Polaribacter sp. TaxID=1920175 RepID=UPI003EFB3B43